VDGISLSPVRDEQTENTALKITGLKREEATGGPPGLHTKLLINGTIHHGLLGYSIEGRDD
jgi:hypothetical protein